MGEAEDALRQAERGLQSAMLAGDVAALDQLLDDRVMESSTGGILELAPRRLLPDVATGCRRPRGRPRGAPALASAGRAH